MSSDAPKDGGLAKTDGVFCDICGEPLVVGDPVLFHDRKDEIYHRGCLPDFSVEALLAPREAKP